jgi:hybrid cluster-associated redox disulfide protein
MAQEHPLPQKSIEEVLTNWPETAVVFKRRTMACIGCPVSQFCTITDAAAVYNLPLEQFIAELENAIAVSC